MTTSTKITVAPVIPSFDSGAKSIIAAQKAADAVAIKTSEAIVMAIQKHLDSCAVAGVPRDLGGVNAIGRSIRDCQVFIDAVAIGFFEKKTITEYGQGAMRAYFHNVFFTASLKNDPAFKIPARDGTVKKGPVSTTTVAALHKTLIKALQQARQLGLIEQAADLLDFCLESFNGFSEADSDSDSYSYSDSNSNSNSDSDSNSASASDVVVGVDDEFNCDFGIDFDLGKL